MTGFDERGLSDLLIAARRERRLLRGPAPRLTPPNEEAGYRVADRVAAGLGWPVVGWKIAGTSTEMQRRLRTSGPIRGRVFQPFVCESPATLDLAELAAPLVEGEIAFVLGRDLPPRAEPYGREEALAAVAAVRPAIEVAECRFGYRELPPIPAILADGSGSGRLVLGPATDDFGDLDLAAVEVLLRVDGRERARGAGADVLDDPANALAWLAESLSRAGIGLEAGQVVSTGTLTGMIVPRVGERHEADFGALGRVEVAFRG